MSRTDKTQPLNVKALFYPDWVEEYHNHVDRECDLPARATHDNIQWHRNTCGWVYSQRFLASDMAKCPCELCHGSWAWDQNAQSERRKARRYVKGDWEKEY